MALAQGSARAHGVDMSLRSRLQILAEPLRASGELATSYGLLAIRSQLPKGTGLPVIVLPGMLIGDGFTANLRRLLRGIGHEAHGWELGRNLGPTEQIVDGLPRRLKEVADASGAPVALVGHSLGGVFARGLTAAHPGLVRMVITLGSPVHHEPLEGSDIRRIFDFFTHRHLDIPPFDEGVPLAKPASALHTRSDAVVPWESCLIQPSPTSENIRIAGSHTGMPFNPAAVWVIADRLAQPEGHWQPLREPGFWGGLIDAGEAADPSTARA